jgi:hypothetical protein
MGLRLLSGRRSAHNPAFYLVRSLGRHGLKIDGNHIFRWITQKSRELRTCCGCSNYCCLAARGGQHSIVGSNPSRSASFAAAVYSLREIMAN